MTKSNKSGKKGGDVASTLAAIDIGSNSIRMVVAEALPDGRIEVIEQLKRAVRLGQDTFRRGRLGGRTVRAAVAILRDCRRLLDLYNVERVRAVATSAVREAANADTFVDRVFMATGLDVEVIDTSEEGRLIVSAVRDVVGSAMALDRSNALVTEVGGGSTLLAVLRQGTIAGSDSLRLGSVRLQEALSTTHETCERSADLMRQRISTIVLATQARLSLKGIRRFVGVGGDMRFAADRAGERTKSPDVRVISIGNFDKLVEHCVGHTAEELGRRYGLAFADAETLTPALLVYHALLGATRAKRIIVPRVSMRDGLLHDLAAQATGEEDESRFEGAIQSAMVMARKYQTDLDHAGHVARLSGLLFEQLDAEHGLGRRHLLLLRTAALLHEIGGFVSSRAHHKHSHYLVVNAEVFGLTREELTVVALVTRYHRRAIPKPSHVEYVNLPRDTRMVVSKLAAILRVADALDRGHAQQVSDVQFERRNGNFVIIVAGAADLALERLALAEKADLFEDIYGMKVRLEESSAPNARERRAKAVE